MAKKRFRIKDSQGNVVPYDVAAEDVTMADGRSVEAGKASLKAVAGFLDPAHFPIVMLYNVAPFTSTPDYSSIPVGIVYLDESLTAPYKRLYYKKSVEGTAQSIDLGAPKDGVIYFHQSTGKLYRWVATSQGNDGSFTQIGILGINDIPGLAEAIANAGSGAVSVTTNQDGTFVIHVGSTDYTINLNHTHENMAKLVVCEESDLPSTLDNSTIYAITDSGETEIEKLIIRGMEFAGGGVPAGTPAITKPSGTTINLGENSGSGVSKTIEIKANAYITGDLTVGLAANSNLSFDTTNLPSGVTYNSGAGTLTIAQATAIQGVNITVVYSGSGAAEIDGGLIITGGGAAAKSVVVVVVELQPIGVKLTGTQWLQTNYYPNAKTEFTMKMKFTSKGNSFDANHAYFLTCASNTSADGEKFQLYHTGLNNIVICNKTSAYYNGSSSDVQLVSASAADFVLDDSIISYSKGQSNGTLAFIPGGDNSKKVTHATSLKTATMQNPIRIGRGNTYYYEQYELTIKELTFTEDGVTVQHWVPRVQNGVPGLYDTVNNTFISSETETQVVPVYNS